MRKIYVLFEIINHAGEKKYDFDWLNFNIAGNVSH